jgi:hypothetical protein
MKRTCPLCGTCVDIRTDAPGDPYFAFHVDGGLVGQHQTCPLSCVSIDLANDLVDALTSDETVAS